jgi:bacterioferritin
LKLAFFRTIIENESYLIIYEVIMDLKRRKILKFLLGSLAGAVVVKPVKSEASLSLNSESEFVSLCNVAISHEYGAIVQYINHAGLINDKGVESLLLSNMGDEVIHARELTRLLVKEGAQPTVAVWPPQTAKELKELIREDIQGETSAIELYQKILDLPESKKYRDLISSFLKREELHRERLKRLLNAISSRYKG